MEMRVTSPVGRRIGGDAGCLHHSGFGQVGFQFAPTDIGQRLSIDFDTRRKSLGVKTGMIGRQMRETLMCTLRYGRTECGALAMG